MRTYTREQRRDHKRHKARYGMRMSGKSTKTVLAPLAATSPARKRSPRR